jgi:hypothetical protein
LLQLDLDVGTCFDLAYRGKGNMYTAMSDRKSVFPAINLRLQHFFSRKWGWYTNIRLGIPVKYRRDCYTELVHAVEANYYVIISYRERKNRTLIPVWILVLLIALKIPIGLFILVWGLV